MTNGIGSIGECWRYPVKSLQGVCADAVDLTAGGVRGDRAFGLVEVGSGRLMSAKRFSALLTAAADDEAITLPDGRVLALDAADVDARLSEWLGRPVHLATPAGTAGLAYEMTLDPPNDDAELFEIPVPDGTFVDLSPLHLLSTATLRGCAVAAGGLDWDRRRFRPNLVIDSDGAAFEENGWSALELAVGSEAVIRVIRPTVRCAMPLRAQPRLGGEPALERQPGLFAAMSELNAAMPNHLGAYAEVVTPGRVAVGDAVVALG